MRKKIIPVLLFVLAFVFSTQPVLAAEGPKASLLANPLALTMIILMVLLLLIIALLGNVLLGIADFSLNKGKKKAEEKQGGQGAKILGLALVLLGSAFSAAAQDAPVVKSSTIAGMSTTTFTVLTAVLFLELFVILALLINIRMLVKLQQPESEKPAKQPAKAKSFGKWWDRFNRIKPIEQESSIDLGHDYDGIRELDNRLPPWWLYGFYASILFAAIYLWRFHVSHTGPSSREELEQDIARAEVKIKAYLKEKGESVDENTVEYLSEAADQAAGKKIFISSCASCHKPDGGGDVGPNLTDKYWIHGGDIKSIFKTIRYGINAMPQWQNSYSNKQIAQVSSYVKSLQGSTPAAAKAPQGQLEEDQPATATDSSATTTAKP